MTAARSAVPIPRDVHKALTRAGILRSARELFTERGFDQVTIADVAAHAGVTSRTLFRYFDTKSALVLHDYRQLLSQMVTAISRRPISEPPFEAICEGIIDFAVARPDSMFIAVGPIWENEQLPDADRHVLQFDVVDQTAQMLVDRYKLYGVDDRLRVRVWAGAGLGAMSSALREHARRTQDHQTPTVNLGRLLRQAFDALSGDL